MLLNKLIPFPTRYRLYQPVARQFSRVTSLVGRKQTKDGGKHPGGIADLSIFDTGDRVLGSL
jgi:hypothetical protein